jgi:hypothetical protein
VQVHGGMGFIEETGAAQYYRDAKNPDHLRRHHRPFRPTTWWAARQRAMVDRLQRLWRAKIEQTENELLSNANADAHSSRSAV